MISQYISCKLYLLDKDTIRHSAKLWCRRTSLNCCVYFEKFDIAYFKKILVLSQSILG